MRKPSDKEGLQGVLETIDERYNGLSHSEAPVPQHAGSGKKRKSGYRGYTFPEVAAYAWEVLVQALDSHARELCQASPLVSVSRGPLVRRILRPEGTARATHHALQGRPPRAVLDADNWSAAAEFIGSFLPRDCRELIEPTSVDECADDIVRYCKLFLGVEVDIALVRNHLGPSVHDSSRAE